MNGVLDPVNIDAGGRYRLMHETEKELRQITELLNRYGVNRPIVSIPPDAMVYTDPNLPPHSFREVFVRYQLYQFEAEYFVLEHEGQPESLLGIRFPRNIDGCVADIGIIATPRGCPCFAEFLRSASEQVADVVLTRPTKIRISIPTDSPDAADLEQLVLKAGFHYEFSSPDELGWGRSINAYVLPIPEPA